MEFSDNKRSRWHRRQNKFAKVWEQTKVTVRLIVSYFNWIWVHSRHKNTAAIRALLSQREMDLERPSYLSHTYLMHDRKTLDF